MEVCFSLWMHYDAARPGAQDESPSGCTHRMTCAMFRAPDGGLFRPRFFF